MKTDTGILSLRNLTTVCTLILAAAIGSAAMAQDLENFCDHLPRAAYSQFEKSPASDAWFEVYEVEDDIWAIYEPFQWQEVISYLVIGRDSALLIDTGNGLGDIEAVVKRLTDKPVQVLNTHSHFDHVGGNYQFEKILSPSTEFSILNSKGSASEQVKMEASEAALCKALPDGVSEQNHRTRPYSITGRIEAGDVVELGGRSLEVISVPGHTDDSIALLDKDSGFLWTGDSFYEGPIWLFFPETDLVAYRESMARLAALVPNLSALFPAHNTPRANPALLVETLRALDLVLQGAVESTPVWEGVESFEFEGFGFLMRKSSTN